MITLTGIDERTDLHAIKKITSTGHVEFAVLMSSSQENNHRYPSLEFIELAADLLQDKLAVHVCGRAARTYTLGGDARYVEALKRVGRIQVNGRLSDEELRDYLSLYEYQRIITQHTEINRSLMLVWGDNRHELLVDNSGGRGILPGAWVRPNTSKPVGFAGGLGPDNLQRELAKMPFFQWVDMESSLRDAENWFSIELAVKCIDIIKNWR